MTDGMTPADGCFNYSPPALHPVRGRMEISCCSEHSLGLESFPSLTSGLAKSPRCQKPFCVGAEARADECPPPPFTWAKQSRDTGS